MAIAPLEYGDDLWERREPLEHRLRMRCGTDDRESMAGVTTAADVPGRLGLERVRDRADQVPCAVQPQASGEAGFGLTGERRDDLGLGLRADARHLAQAPGGRGLPQLVRGPHPERAGDVDRARGAQPEVAAEPDEAGDELTLELGELGDLSRLQQLAQASLDPRTDAFEHAPATACDELLHRRRAAPDRVRRPAVGADRVRIGVAELQHRGKRVEPVGDLSIGHDLRHATAASLRQRHPRELGEAEALPVALALEPGVGAESLGRAGHADHDVEAVTAGGREPLAHERPLETRGAAQPQCQLDAAPAGQRSRRGNGEDDPAQTAGSEPGAGQAQRADRPCGGKRVGNRRAPDHATSSSRLASSATKLSTSAPARSREIR